MALIKCPECAKEISDKATACIGCGAPIHSAPPTPADAEQAKPKTKGIDSVLNGFVGMVLLILLVWFFLPGAAKTVQKDYMKEQPVNSFENPTPKAPSKEPKDDVVDYTKPLYTKRHSLVCPIGVLLDKREGYGLSGAEDAVLSWSQERRESRLMAIGCSEWKEGIRIYIRPENKDFYWQQFSTHPDEISENLILGIHVRN